MTWKIIVLTKPTPPHCRYWSLEQALLTGADVGTFVGLLLEGIAAITGLVVERVSVGDIVGTSGTQLE